MQVHDHVNTLWPRCDSVKTEGDQLILRVSRGRCYDLVDSYRMSPHRQLIGLRSASELLGFVRAFGPLFFSEPGVRTEKLSHYWSFQQSLKAFVFLLSAMRGGELAEVRKAVTEYIKATEAEAVIEIRGLRGSGRHARFPRVGRVFGAKAICDLIAQSEDSRVGQIAIGFVENSFTAELGFRVTASARKFHIAAQPRLLGLAEALRWMVWQDVHDERPLSFCPECGSLIKVLDARFRKFCSPEHAHRSAARDWRRRDSERKPRLKRSNQKEGRP
jgi:hypothetical protein